MYDWENDVDAVTSGYCNPFGSLNIDISFNGNTMPSVSREYIIETLHHGVSRDKQHEPIALEFRNTLANTLMQHFPTIAQADANSLVWLGLSETKA